MELSGRSGRTAGDPNKDDPLKHTVWRIGDFEMWRLECVFEVGNCFDYALQDYVLFLASKVWPSIGQTLAKKSA